MNGGGGVTHKNLGQVSRFKIDCRRLGMIGSKHYGKAVANRY